MATLHDLTSFIFKWKKQNHKQLQVVTQSLRNIEGETGSMFDQDQMMFGEWARYHHEQGVKEIRLEDNLHLHKVAQMAEEIVRREQDNSPPVASSWVVVDPFDPDTSIDDPALMRQELEELNQDLSEIITQKQRLLNVINLELGQRQLSLEAAAAEEEAKRKEIGHWMKKKSELRHECQRLENTVKEIKRRRDAVSDGTPTCALFPARPKEVD